MHRRFVYESPLRSDVQQIHHQYIVAMESCPTSHDLFRFSTIAHSNHRYLSPLSGDKANGLLRSLTSGLSADDFVLDAGCGKGALLRDALKMSPARGVGVDINKHFIDEARELLGDEALDHSRFTLLDCPLLEHNRPTSGYSAIICVGSRISVGGSPAGVDSRHTRGFALPVRSRIYAAASETDSRVVKPPIARIRLMSDLPRFTVFVINYGVPFLQ
jgi:SAM-dependent methyltransferase